MSLWSGILLVAGTCIGGGMLALPVLMSPGGFLPSILVFVLTWVFMASTGLLFLEVSQWVKADSNIISMSEKTLGPFGKAATWIVYLFFFFCLTIAYIVGCGNLFSNVFGLPEHIGPLAFVILFAPPVLAGPFVIHKINSIMMAGLGISYFAFIFLGLKFIKADYLLEANWLLSASSLPIAFTSFGYQGIIPTLHRYLNHDVVKTRKAILIGSFIPLVTYIIWQTLILGIVPASALAETLQKGENAVYPLKNFIQDFRVYTIGQFFAFFALITSFFGVTLGLTDFLADGLRIQNRGTGKLTLAFIVFVIPTIIAVTYPHLFLSALDLAGGFGSSLLLGVLPISMVWVGRYYHSHNTQQILPGGRITLTLLALYVLFEIGFELLKM